MLVLRTPITGISMIKKYMLLIFIILKLVFSETLQARPYILNPSRWTSHETRQALIALAAADTVINREHYSQAFYLTGASILLSQANRMFHPRYDNTEAWLNAGMLATMCARYGYGVYLRKNHF